MQFVEDCGPGSNTNPLLNYVKTFTDDKAAWQDQFAVANNYGPLRQSGPHPARQQQEKQLFHKFIDNREHGQFSPFQMTQQGPRPMWEGPQQSPMMGYSREAIENQHQAWISDYQHAVHPQEFEQAWSQPRPSPSRPPQLAIPPSSWANQYDQQEEFEQVFKQIENRVDRSQWAEKFAEEEEIGAARNERLKDLAKEVISIPDPKLQNSSFMQTFTGLVSGDLKPTQDGNLVEATPGAKLANEFASQESWADQMHRQMGPEQSLANQFMEQQGTWAEQYDRFQEGEETEEQWLARWAKIQASQQEWAESYLGNTDWDEALVDQYERVYNGLTQHDDSYEFQPNNPFTRDPDALAKGIHYFNEGQLTESVLALEAAVQQDPSNSQAWTSLGLARAENDQDKLAIQALEQAVAIDHGNLPALMALAVSQTNEYNKDKAALALQQWLIQNPKYTQLTKGFQQPPPSEGNDNLIKMVTSMYIEAARQSSTVDPDVHTALGLFYNLSCDYAKAVDCFRAALSVRPDDYALWNKLGATMANDFTMRNQNIEVTIDAYFRALEKKPSYTRARSNLGISYLSAHNYIEAAKCFLGALSINNSEHLWSSLRQSFQLMHRPDLIEKCVLGNVAVFANDFDF